MEFVASVVIIVVFSGKEKEEKCEIKIIKFILNYIKFIKMQDMVVQVNQSQLAFIQSFFLCPR